MKLFIHKLLTISMFVSVLTLVFGATAAAHVVVRPAEVVTAGFTTFTIGAPNEKDIPTTSIKLLIPDGLKHVSPTQKAGWRVNTEKEGSGEEATVKSITWSGNTIDVGMRDEFTFSAQVPEETTDLQWKAYQTYSDGTVVSWDKSSEGGHGDRDDSSGPFSVTKVVTETAQDATLKAAGQTASEAKSTASRAMYIGIAGVVLGLAGIFLATRKSN